MSENFSVALTGGIASGKSLVAQAFNKLGAAIIDADQVARQVVEPGQPALEEIRSYFGAEMLNTDGTLKRRKMREAIFSDAQARLQLEAITHPHIRREMARQRDASQQEYSMLVIPLLVRGHMTSLADRVLVVDAPTSIQLERLMARDEIDQPLAEKMIAAQDSRAEYLKAADDVLFNTGPRKDIANLSAALHAGYARLARGEIHDLPPMLLPG